MTFKKFSALALFFLATFVISAQSIGDDKNTFDIVDSKQFVFEAESLTSSSGFHRNLTSYYELRVEGDSASASLPFFGRAYSGAYAGDGGISFDNVMEEYSVELKEKKKEKNNVTYIKFSVRGENDNFNCTLSTTSSGTASLTINSTNRQTISYMGTVREIEAESSEE